MVHRKTNARHKNNTAVKISTTNDKLHRVDQNQGCIVLSLRQRAGESYRPESENQSAGRYIELSFGLLVRAGVYMNTWVYMNSC